MVSSSRSPSSSLTKKMKTSKLSPIQQKIFKKASCSYARRQDTIFRKASQLSDLCDVQVCVIWFESDGDLKTWPEDRNVVKSMAKEYIALSEEQRRKGSVTLHEVLEEIKKNKKKLGDLLPKVTSPVSGNTRSSRIGNYSGDEIRELIQSLEHTQTEFLERIQNKKKNNMGTHHEPTMNHHLHLQQQSNHVSFFNYNHGDGDITQIPQVSASDFSLGQFLDPSLQLMNGHPYSDVGNSSIMQPPLVSASDSNQEQSLAPLPPELRMNYSFYDVGNYFGSLGVQGTEINGFENMNTGSFGVQGYGSYGFQNMNMLSYNNIHVNDSSSLY